MRSIGNGPTTWVQHALQTGVMRTAFGWTCRTGITEFNERSIRNWPVQAAGADILRIACILAARHGIKLLAPIHDAVLIEAPIERIEADVALMQEIMRRASRIVLNADRRGDARAAHRRNDYPLPGALQRPAGSRDLGKGNKTARRAAAGHSREAYVMAARSKDPFVKVPLWWAEAAAKATRTPGFLVCIELLRASWKAKSLTFSASNKRLAKAGVSREVKRRVLRDLEAAGLVTIERRPGRSPRVTLVVL